MSDLNGLGTMTGEEAGRLNPLVLAYLGDTVYDLYIRTSLILDERGKAGALHRLSIQFVNARFQAQVARRVVDSLEEDEKAVFMRGRNAKSSTVPKNMSVVDYHQATALEAVIGYCYLTGRVDRIEEIMREALHATSPSES
ncbi:MAG: ribonuclease III domain-containing protein [Eubacteriales bacterium]